MTDEKEQNVNDVFSNIRKTAQKISSSSASALNTIAALEEFAKNKGVFRNRLQQMTDALQAAEQSAEIRQNGRKKYTKKAFFLNGCGGERPFGLNFRNTALVEYDGVTYKPTKVERYILDGLVYYDGSKEADAYVKEVAGIAKRNLSFPDFAKFVKLRNIEFVLHYYCMNLHNDFYILENLQEQFGEIENKTEKTDDDKEQAETLRLMLDCQRLTVEMKIEAADKFLKEQNVPPFLTFGRLQGIKEQFAAKCPPKLFDTLKETQNAKELNIMFEEYLKHRLCTL